MNHWPYLDSCRLQGKCGKVSYPSHLWCDLRTWSLQKESEDLPMEPLLVKYLNIYFIHTRRILTIQWLSIYSKVLNRISYKTVKLSSKMFLLVQLSSSSEGQNNINFQNRHGTVTTTLITIIEMNNACISFVKIM